MDSETLNQQLRISETARDPDLRADLEVVLSVHFPKGVSAGDVVQYRTEADEVALVVTHDENGHIKDLRSGPALREDDLEALQRRIDRDLLGDTASAVRREILFSDLPVTGSFRYRDRFEITPPPSGAPTPEYVLADHPFTLEVAHRSSADARLRMQRGIRETYATGLLLSGLVPWIGWMRPGYVEQRWAVRLGQESGDLRSEWVQLMYTFPGFDVLADDLSSEAWPAIEQIDAQSFYAKRGIGPDDVLQLPVTFELMLDRFYALAPEHRDRFLRWAYWLNHARHVWNLSHSAYYMALIQAVEALHPRRSGATCPSCGLQTGPGPTQQFVDFMERHVPRQDTETEKERRELYRLRSALSHGGKLLSRDLQFGFFGGFQPAALSERETSDRAAMLARIAGINWLLRTA